MHRRVLYNTVKPTPMSEDFLHFLWQHRLYKQGLFVSDQGHNIEIVHPGLPNTDSGPDFFNAKIKLDNVLWAGNVEIHLKASDWNRHQHHLDHLYDNVVLHVVLENDAEVHTAEGRSVPAWEIQIPQSILQSFNDLNRHRGWIHCEKMIGRFPGFEISSWIERMLVEKLERKVDIIETLLDGSRNDWQSVFYVMLTRNFGFGLNGDPFEQLARQTPWTIVARNADSQEKLEALLLGQAGFLDGIMYEDEYVRLLKREYALMQRKYNLKPLPAHLWKFLRLRPGNFPSLRLVQLAAILSAHPTMFDKMLECQNLSVISELFQVEPCAYWNSHYKPDVKGKRHSTRVGKQAIELIIINTVVPLLFAYGKLRGLSRLRQKSFDLLETLPPERNSIVRKWNKTLPNVNIRSAAETQGLVYLKKNYCDQHKCLICRVAQKVMAQSFEE